MDRACWVSKNLAENKLLLTFGVQKYQKNRRRPFCPRAPGQTTHRKKRWDQSAHWHSSLPATTYSEKWTKSSDLLSSSWKSPQTHHKRHHLHHPSTRSMTVPGRPPLAHQSPHPHLRRGPALSETLDDPRSSPASKTYTTTHWSWRSWRELTHRTAWAPQAGASFPWIPPNASTTYDEL